MKSAIESNQTFELCAHPVNYPGTPDITFQHQKIVVVVPAFNEERFIGSVVLKLKRFSVQVVVVDDGSSDGTAEIAEEAGAIVLRQRQNKGKGMALNAGFRYARDLNPDVIVILDADGQHLPEELPQIIRPVVDGQADIVIGSRYLQNKSTTPLGRRIGHGVINLVTSLSSGVLVSDSQSGYRAFSQKAYQCAHFYSNGFSVESEMQFLAQEYGLKVKEVPITIRYTDPGKRSAVRQGLAVVDGILRMVGQYRPLLFFGVPGLVLFVTGFAWGIVVIERYNETHILATGYTILCVLLALLGMLMLSTAVTLHSVRGLLGQIKHDIRDLILDHGKTPSETDDK